MITILVEAVLVKHGPISLIVDKTGRYGIKKVDQPNEEYRHWSFSIGSCFIRMLAEDKK